MAYLKLLSIHSYSTQFDPTGLSFRVGGQHSTVDAVAESNTRRRADSERMPMSFHRSKAAWPSFRSTSVPLEHETPLSTIQHTPDVRLHVYMGRKGDPIAAFTQCPAFKGLACLWLEGQVYLVAVRAKLWERKAGQALVRSRPGLPVATATQNLGPHQPQAFCAVDRL